MALPKSVSYSLPHEQPTNVVSWSIDPNRAVVLVHDMQEYFVRSFDRAADPLAVVDQYGKVHGLEGFLLGVHQDLGGAGEGAGALLSRPYTRQDGQDRP